MLLTAEASELREVEGERTLSLLNSKGEVCLGCRTGESGAFVAFAFDAPKSNPGGSEKKPGVRWSTEFGAEGDVGAEVPAFSRSARRHA